jgi:hypothetical protein
LYSSPSQDTKSQQSKSYYTDDIIKSAIACWHAHEGDQATTGFEPKDLPKALLLLPEQFKEGNVHEATSINLIAQITKVLSIKPAIKPSKLHKALQFKEESAETKSNGKPKTNSESRESSSTNTRHQITKSPIRSVAVTVPYSMHQ